MPGRVKQAAKSGDMRGWHDRRQGADRAKPVPERDVLHRRADWMNGDGCLSMTFNCPWSRLPQSGLVTAGSVKGERFRSVASVELAQRHDGLMRERAGPAGLTGAPEHAAWNPGGA